VSEWHEDGNAHENRWCEKMPGGVWRWRRAPVAGSWHWKVAGGAHGEGNRGDRHESPARLDGVALARVSN